MKTCIHFFGQRHKEWRVSDEKDGIGFPGSGPHAGADGPDRFGSGRLGTDRGSQ